MNSTYTLTVTSRTDNNALRLQLLDIIQQLQESPKVVEIRLDYNTARGRSLGMEHNPVVRRRNSRRKWS